MKCHFFNLRLIRSLIKRIHARAISPRKQTTPTCIRTQNQDTVPFATLNHLRKLNLKSSIKYLLLASFLLSFATSFININIPTVEASNYPPDFGTKQDIKLHVFTNDESRNAFMQIYRKAEVGLYIAKTDASYNMTLNTIIKIDNLESDYTWGSTELNYPVPFGGAFFYGVLVGVSPLCFRFIEDEGQLKAQYLYTDNTLELHTGLTTNINYHEWYNFTMTQLDGDLTFYRNGTNLGSQSDGVATYEWDTVYQWIGEGSQEKLKCVYERDETDPDPDYIGYGGVWVEDYMMDFGNGVDSQRYFGDDFEDWGVTSPTTPSEGSAQEPSPPAYPELEFGSIDDDPKHDVAYQKRSAYFKTFDGDCWHSGIVAENPKAYKYAYLQDGSFSNRNTEPDAKWFCYLWKNNHYYGMDYPYSKIQDDLLHTRSIEFLGTEVANAGVNQGKQAHLWGDYAKLLGSNTTLDDVEFCDYIYFTPNSLPDDYWFETRVRVTERKFYKPVVTGHYRGKPLTTVDFCLNFEYFTHDVFGDKHPQYDDPDAQRGAYTWSSQIIYDMFLDYCEGIWDWGTLSFSENHWTVGDSWTEEIGKYDQDSRYLLVQGQMMELGVWHTFKFNMTYLLEKIFAEMWSGNLDALILRGVTFAVESCGAEISAEWDYVRLRRGDDFSLDVTANCIDGHFAGDVEVTFNAGSTMYSTPKIFVNSPQIFLLSAESDVYFNDEELQRTYHYDFVQWKFDTFNVTTEDCYFVGEMSATAIIEYVFRESWDTGGGGGGGGRFYAIVKSPLQYLPSDYGWMSTITESTYVDPYLTFVNIRKSLGNVNGTIALDIYVSKQLVFLDTVSIDKVKIDLGNAWEHYGRHQWFSFSAWKVDDVTAQINIDNVTSCEVVFQNVPNVMSVSKNLIRMEKGEFWDYKEGDLYLYMDYGDPEIFIDFETVGSITMEGFEVIVILLFASMVLVIIKRWKSDF